MEDLQGWGGGGAPAARSDGTAASGRRHDETHGGPWILCLQVMPRDLRSWSRTGTGQHPAPCRLAPEPRLGALCPQESLSLSLPLFSWRWWRQSEGTEVSLYRWSHRHPGDNPGSAWGRPWSSADTC